METLVAAVEALGFDALGKSTDGRAIRGRRFGGPGPALLVFGGIHGDEPASVEALIELAPRLAAAGRAGVPVWRCTPRSPASTTTVRPTHGPRAWPPPAGGRRARTSDTRPRGRSEAGSESIAECRS